MASLNVKVPGARTHEGGAAVSVDSEMQLRRAVMTCMLWEDGFYSDGVTIADRIRSLIPQVEPRRVAAIAVEARSQMNLRHVPLLIVREMARLSSHKSLVGATLSEVIQRPDELAEFCAIWQSDDKRSLSKTLSAQAKKGLALAFSKFDEYSLSKYSRDGAVKLRDVLFLCHAKPNDEAQDALWKRLIAGELETPDTWEVELSASADKKASWTRLLTEGKLFALALLRNLRNMQQAGVDSSLISDSITRMKADRVLPFRFIAAARYGPQFEPQLEQAMFRNLGDAQRLSGRTTLLIDISGSMDAPLSAKSEMTRLEAACGLAMLLREIGDCRIFTFTDNVVEIPPRRGFALRDAITGSQVHGGTRLGLAVEAMKQFCGTDRLIVVTDEQSSDPVGSPSGRGYMVNVASDQHAVGFGAWNRITGFSESITNYIRTLES